MPYFHNLLNLNLLKGSNDCINRIEEDHMTSNTRYNEGDSGKDSSKPKRIFNCDSTSYLQH